MRLTPFNISIFSIFILPPLGYVVYSIIDLNKMENEYYSRIIQAV